MNNILPVNEQWCVLVELDVNVGGIETTLYLSNIGYVSAATDTPPNTLYTSGIEGSIQFTESFSLDGTISVSVGDISINNADGTRDSWFTYVFNNRAIRIYIGSINYTKASFQLALSGIMAKILPSSIDRINIQMLDKLQQLNTPLSDIKVGGIDSNADTLLPNLFGECCNITPLAIDPATVTYKVHNGVMERVIEIRDNGAPVTGFTANLAEGSFTLTTAPTPNGTITVSAQGDKTPAYTNTIAAIIKRIVTSYGNVSTQFTDSDINLLNFSDFDSTHLQPIGLYVTDKQNILDIINQLAYSIGAYCYMNRLGKLTILQLTLPGVGTPILITPDMIMDSSLSLSELVPIVAAVKLGYCKNWTVQNNLQTGIPEEHKTLFAKEYLTTTQIDTTVSAKYKLSGEPEQQNTLLLKTVDAKNEAIRRLNLFSTQRYIYEFESIGDSVLWSIGQAVILKYPRFGLHTGKEGVIIKIQADFITGRTRVAVLV